MRQALVLLLYSRIAVGKPLTFVRASAAFIESGAVIYETQFTSRQS